MAAKSGALRARSSLRPPPAQEPTARPALRDAERTRRAILKAATAEFAENGLAGARVDRIADVSGVNKRMLYYYFNNKDDLYLAVLEEAYIGMRASERDLKLDHLEPMVAIRKLVEFKFDYFVENPAMIWLLNGENMLGAQHLKRSARLTDMHISLVRTIGKILDAGVAAGTIRPNVDPLQLYMSISGLSYFFFSNGPTLSTAFGKELRSAPARAARRAHVLEVILGYLRPSL
ncbi:MAG: TetR/AcrR family transcriptional regulator [Methylobacteriaceae bacterium]|jgi:AcrR family transcriptional regulator|nr:TetR/AcrR family transcriptional regulator [Methylobacteriaceae bacterium]